MLLTQKAALQGETALKTEGFFSVLTKRTHCSRQMNRAKQRIMEKLRGGGCGRPATVVITPRLSTLTAISTSLAAVSATSMAPAVFVPLFS